MEVIPVKFIETKISGLYVIEPSVFEDNRGYFFEVHNKSIFEANGLMYDFIQDNQSFSYFGTIRGLHFQKGIYAQAKLVYVSSGAVLDVAVDLRENSPTFGEHVSVELSQDNRKMLLIPRGFAHGFSVLSKSAVFHYKCDNIWNKESEGGIRFNDPDLKIDWKINMEDAIISEKDKLLPYVNEYSGNLNRL
jgi:dTDP-4-dehydrorhamnose 3,5-epimerase